MSLLKQVLRSSVAWLDILIRGVGNARKFCYVINLGWFLSINLDGKLIQIAQTLDHRGRWEFRQIDTKGPELAMVLFKAFTEMNPEEAAIIPLL